MTDGRASVRFSNPATKREQPFRRKQHSRWLSESKLPESLVFPLFWPSTSTVAIQVPKRTHAALVLVASQMTNYFWAYYQKSALSGWREWSWGEGGRAGLRSQTKPSEHRQIKRDTHFSGCRPSKRIHLDQKWLSAGGSAPHRSKTLNMVLSVCSDRLRVASLWFSSNVHKRGELIFAKVTKPNPEICFCAALCRLWNTITLSPPPPLPVCSQLNKPLYPVIPLLSATLFASFASWLLASFLLLLPTRQLSVVTHGQFLSSLSSFFNSLRVRKYYQKINTWWRCWLIFFFQKH